MIKDIEEESKTKFSMKAEFSFSFKALHKIVTIPFPFSFFYTTIIKKYTGRISNTKSGAYDYERNNLTL